MNNFRKLIDIVSEADAGHKYDLTLFPQSQDELDYVVGLGGVQSDNKVNFSDLVSSDVMRILTQLKSVAPGAPNRVELNNIPVPDSNANLFMAQMPSVQEKIRAIVTALDEPYEDWMPYQALENIQQFLQQSGHVLAEEEFQDKINGVDIYIYVYGGTADFNSTDSSSLLSVVKSFLSLADKGLTVKTINQIDPRTRDKGSVASVVANLLVSGGDDGDLENQLNRARSVRKQSKRDDNHVIAESLARIKTLAGSQ